MVASFILNACDRITLRAPDCSELAGSIMLFKVFLGDFFFTAIVLAYHLDKATLFPVLHDLAVLNLLVASQISIFTLDGQLSESFLDHWVRLVAGERLSSAGRAGCLRLVLTEVKVLFRAQSAESSPALPALDWLFKDILADTAVQNTHLVFLDFFDKLVLLDRRLSAEGCQRLVLSLLVISDNKLYFVGICLGGNSLNN